MNYASRGPFFEALASRVAELGGSFNAHLHLDRYATLEDRYFVGTELDALADCYVPLKKKHSLINNIHAGPAYQREDLQRRVNACLDLMVASNTRRADTMVLRRSICGSRPTRHWVLWTTSPSAGRFTGRGPSWPTFWVASPSRMTIGITPHISGSWRIASACWNWHRR